MQTSHQTLDAMLAKSASTANQADSGAGSVTGYNQRDNSFDNVLQEQRNRRSESQRPADAATQRKAAERSGASEQESRAAATGTAKSGSTAAASGNELPAQEDDSTRPVEAAGLAGLQNGEPEVTEVLSVTGSESGDTGVLDDTTGSGAAGLDDTADGAELAVAQQNDSGRLAAAGETARAQRGAAAPAGLIAAQGEAALAQAGSDQPGSMRGDTSGLQETRAFKEALQQLRSGALAAPGSEVAADVDAGDIVTQTARNLARVDHLLPAGQTAAIAKPELATGTIPVPVSSPNWGQAMAQRVLWLASNGIQAAEMQLHPRELGPVEIRISVANDQTQVQFSSQYGVVRETLEASTQRLRELFDASGLQLLDVNVSDQSLSEQRRSGQEGEADATGRGVAAEDTGPLASPTIGTVSGAGLVDYYV